MGKKGAEQTGLVPAEETGMVPAAEVSAEDLFQPGLATAAGDEAGLGSEDLDADGVILPRIKLLQAMSKAVSEGGDDGPKPGTYWLTLFNRPATIRSTDGLKFVVVQIFNAQRLWRHLDDGGGIVCQAPTGKLVALEPNGLTGASLDLAPGADGRATKAQWTGGEPTDQCRRCVLGLGASAGATGQPSGKANAWLPKVVVQGGQRVTIPDELRVPKCQTSVDALILVLVPAHNGLKAEIVPAYISFQRSSFGAGRTLAGMIKIAGRQPAWAKMYELGSKKTQNDKATFHVATVKVLGSTPQAVCDMARSLYDEAANSGTYRPDMSDMQDDVIDVTPGEAGPVGSEEPAPDDQF